MSRSLFTLMRSGGLITRRARAFLVSLMVAGAFAMLGSSALASGLQVEPAGSVFPQRAVVVSGQGIAGLSPSTVHVVENGAPVHAVAVHFLRRASAKDFGVVLVIDVSANVASIERAVAAARGLAAERPAQGMLGIVEADAFPPTALPLTRDAAAINTALATTPIISRHGLHVYDAVLTAVGMLRTAGIASGSVILLSDGADRGDAATLQQVLASAIGGHIRIFSVGIASPRFDPQALRSVAEPSGGAFVEAGSQQLPEIFTTLESRLSTAYLIRYLSAQRAGQRVAASLRIDGVPGAFNISYLAPPIGAGLGRAAAPVHKSFWTSTAVALLVSLLCALLIGVATWSLLRRREGVLSRVGAFVASVGPGLGPKPRTLVQRALGDPRRRRRRSPWFDALVLELDVARLDISPARLALITVVGTALLGWLLVSVTSSPIGAILGFAFPVAVVIAIRFLAGRQRRQFEEQLPDNLQVLASAMRAGHTFLGALGVVAEDAPDPSRRELRQALTDEQLGVPITTSLERVSTRMKSTDFQQVTLIATLQRDTGGNTAEVIDLVTETVRDRLDIRRFIRTLTAQGRLSGGILTALPIALLIAISIINPSYTYPLFHKAIGIIALVVAGGMVLTGALILRRIINIEV